MPPRKIPLSQELDDDDIVVKNIDLCEWKQPYLLIQRDLHPGSFGIVEKVVKAGLGGQPEVAARKRIKDPVMPMEKIDTKRTYVEREVDILRSVKYSIHTFPNSWVWNKRQWYMTALPMTLSSSTCNPGVHPHF